MSLIVWRNLALVLFTPPFVKDVPTQEQARIALHQLSQRISTSHRTPPLLSVAPTNHQSEIITQPSDVKVFPLPRGYAPPPGSNKGREATRWNLTLAVVTGALQENGINASKAEVEEMARQIKEGDGLRFSDLQPPRAVGSARRSEKFLLDNL